MPITPPRSASGQGGRTLVTKEFFVGLLAIALGGYNLLPYFGVNLPPFEPPKIVANIVLVIAGLILWVTAYKLWRFRWHSRGLF
jgi:hypothetical protein